MRMSQQLAHSIAKKLTEKKQKHIEALETKLANRVKQVYLSQQPISIRRLFQKHPEYFKAKQIIRVHGFGLNYKSVQLKENILCNDAYNHVAFVKMDADLGQEFSKSFN